jgi:hypothetical protein
MRLGQARIAVLRVRKKRILIADHLVDTCSNVYRDDEIMAAGQIIVDAGIRLSKRQGDKKAPRINGGH